MTLVNAVSTVEMAGPGEKANPVGGASPVDQMGSHGACQQEMIIRGGGMNCVAPIDLHKGCWQVLLVKDVQSATAFRSGGEQLS